MIWEEEKILAEGKEEEILAEGKGREAIERQWRSRHESMKEKWL